MQKIFNLFQKYKISSKDIDWNNVLPVTQFMPYI